MAIKGKKKSQNRGSQARRRPAAPPRLAVQPRTRTRWYRSQTGIATLGILAILAIGVTVWAVQNASDKAAALENKQEALDGYTDRVRGVLQTLRAPVGNMAGAPPQLQEPEQAEALAEGAAGWMRDLEKAQTSFGKIAVDPELQSIHDLYAHSIQIYISAARTYELAGTTTDEEARVDTLGLANTQRDEAGAIWTEATALLDQRRDAAELDPSGLTAPNAPAGGAAPPAPGEIPTEIPTGIPTEIPTDGLPPEGDQPAGDGGNPAEGGGGRGDKPGGGDKGAGSDGR